MSSELDLELLEVLLDGELPVEDEDALRSRLGSEPALAQALDRLRAQRAVRQSIWRGVEPREAEVNRLLATVHSHIRHDQLWSRRARALRYVSGLAACIVVGFMIGRFLPYGSIDERDNGIVFEPGRGAMQEVADTGPGPQRPNGFKVLLTDTYGRVIAEQRFETFSEAREFTEDLSRAQNHYRAPQPAMPLHSPPAPRVNDTHFIKGEF